MSTKFTPEYISKAMAAAAFLGEPACTELREALLEIMRLSGELALLRLKAVNEGELDSRYWIASYGNPLENVVKEAEAKQGSPARIAFHDFGWEEGVQRYRALVDLETGGLLRVQLLTPEPKDESKEKDSPG